MSDIPSSLDQLYVYLDLFYAFFFAVGAGAILGVLFSHLLPHLFGVDKHGAEARRGNQAIQQGTAQANQQSSQQDAEEIKNDQAHQAAQQGNQAQQGTQQGAGVRGENKHVKYGSFFLAFLGFAAVLFFDVLLHTWQHSK
jgi:hypothetical protein